MNKWDYIFPIGMEIIIWGAGNKGKYWLNFLSSIGRKIKCFFDKNKEGKIDGIPIYAPALNDSDCILLISPVSDINNIFKSARSLGFTNIKIGEMILEYDLIKLETEIDNYKRFVSCLDKWMENRESKKSIVDFLKSNNYEHIGIYGYNVLGKHIVQELNIHHFPICWVIDSAAQGDEHYDTIIKPDDFIFAQNVDLIIIAEIDAIEEIEFRLTKYTSCAILSIEEIVLSLYYSEK